MNLKNIKEEIECLLNKKKLKLYDISFHGSDNTLTVLLDEELKMDDLSNISSEISSCLDKYESTFPDNYILDVSNVGLERPIKSIEEVNKAINQYVYIKTKEAEYYGTILNVLSNMIELSVLNKNINKVITVDYSNVKKMRYAVKF